MARDPSPRRSHLLNKVTIIQLQTELLQRQLRRRDGLSEADRRWLEAALATTLRTTRELTTLIVEDEEPPRRQGVAAVPRHRLLVLPQMPPYT
jgi:hypothetical protein